MGSILDDHQFMVFGDGLDRIHVAGMAREMHGNNGPCFRGDLFLDPVRIQIQGSRLDVDKNRFQPLSNHDVGSGRKRHGCGDDLITILKTHCGNGKMEPRRTGAQPDRMTAANVVFKRVFKPFRFFPCGQPS